MRARRCCCDRSPLCFELLYGPDVAASARVHRCSLRRSLCVSSDVTYTLDALCNPQSCAVVSAFPDISKPGLELSAPGPTKQYPWALQE